MKRKLIGGALVLVLLAAQPAIAANPLLGKSDGGTGTALGVGGTTFTATGGQNADSAANRLTFSGIRMDLRADFGAKCDGTTNDSSVLTSAINALKATSVPVTLILPAKCIVDWANYVITGPLSFMGLNGGGLKISSGQTLSGPFLRWQGAVDGVSIRNVSIDLNGNSVANTGITSVLNFFISGGPTIGLTNLTVADNHIFNAGTIPTGGSLELIFGYSVNVSYFHHNTLQINTASAEGNECFDAGSQTQPMIDLDFSDNTCINTAFGLFGASGRTTISNNRISGFGFGAGITAETVGYTDTAIKNMVIANNSITNSLSAQDKLGTNLDGIEIGFYGVTVTGNTINGMCGLGIGFYGAPLAITGNTISNVGKCNTSTFYNSGIASLAPASSAAAFHTLIDGNTVYDDGGGNTTYGFSDVQNVTGIELGTNFFQGSQGAYNLSGEGVQFLNPQIDNRIVNPCFQIDQKNAGSTVVSGFIADQWRGQETSGNISLAQIQTQMGQCYHALNAQVATQVVPGATDNYTALQGIALYDVRDFSYGSIYAKDGIVAFCAKYSGATPFTTSVFIQNINATMTWTHPFTISAISNTLQCFSFTVPADYANSLGITPTNVAFRVGFNLGSGSAKLISPNVWTAGISLGSTGDAALVSQTVGTNLKISDVRFLPVGADEGWSVPKYDDMLTNAQRFYRTSFPFGTKPAQNAGATGQLCAGNQIANGQPSLTIPFDLPMVSSPTITTYNPAAANANWRNTTISSDVVSSVPASGTSINGFTIQAGTPVISVNDLLCIHYFADASLQ